MVDRPKSLPTIKIVAYSRPDGDHPIYAAIGNIAAEWAYLEYVLDQIIAELLSSTDNARLACLTSQMMGAGPRYRAIISLLKIEQENINRVDIKPTPHDLSGKIISLSNKTLALAEHRNRIVHDPWYLDLSASLADTYEKIADLVEAALKFRNTIHEMRAAWHGKPLPQPLVTLQDNAQSREVLAALLDRIPSSDQ
jgi:hypothetical protein